MTPDVRAAFAYRPLRFATQALGPDVPIGAESL